MKLLSLAVALPLTLSGCAVSTMYDREGVINNGVDHAERVTAMGTKLSRQASNVVMVDDYYIADAGFKLSERELLPEFFEHDVYIGQHRAVSIQEVIGMIARETKRRVILTDDAVAYLDNKSGEDGASNVNNIDESMKGPVDTLAIAASSQKLPGAGAFLNIDHEGTLSELLDLISSKTGLYWKYSKGQIVFFRYETVTEYLALDSGYTNFSSSVDSSSSAGGDGQTTGSQHKTSFESAAGDGWAAVQEAIYSMASEEGRSAFNQTLGFVTITDTPDRVRLMQDYIKRINEYASERISIGVKIYDIEIEDGQEFGSGWDMQYAGSERASIIGSNGASEALATITSTLLTGRFANSKLFVEMLDRSTLSYTETSHTFNTVNGAAVPIQVVDEIPYLKKVTAVLDDTTSTTRFEIEQDVVNSGVSMTVLPRMTGRQSMNVTFAADIGKLLDLKTEEFGDGSKVQLADRSTKNYLSRIPMRSGETVMLSGFERTTHISNKQGLPDKDAWVLGGKMDSSAKRIMTVVLLTPHIISKE